MKKNLYYKTVFQRKNAFKEFIYAFFQSICSIPRLLLEVFVRRNMGERYFSFSTAIVAVFFLAWLPVVFSGSASLFNRYGNQEFSFWSFLGRYLTWYVYLAGFVYVCLLRRREIRRLPSVFDFARFSLSAGIIHPLFFRINFGHKNVDIRQVETIVEPAFFFLIGFSLQMLAQPVGLLIMVCAICYSLSYLAVYHQGDNFIMDKIDEFIYNEKMVNNFSDALPNPNDDSNVPFYGRIPADAQKRRELLDYIIVDTDFVEAR